MGGAAVVALPVFLAGSFVLTSRAQIVVDYLRHVLPGLALSEPELASFAQQYVGRVDPQDRKKRYYDSIFFFMKNPTFEVAIPDRYKYGYELVTRNLLTTFLLSTDFFSVAEQRPEHTSYIAFADPYELVCRNPMAQFELKT
jgi:hypothetical protein